MIRHIAGAALAVILATQAAAQAVLPCDWRAQADAIVEPWEDHSRTFANGNVRVALIDAVEPALGAFYLLILSPPYDEVGARQCRIIGFQGEMGFTTIDFDNLTADYSPDRGLEVKVPARIGVPEYDFTNVAHLWITINQATGEITTFMELGRE